MLYSEGVEIPSPALETYNGSSLINSLMIVWWLERSFCVWTSGALREKNTAKLGRDKSLSSSYRTRNGVCSMDSVMERSRNWYVRSEKERWKGALKEKQFAQVS